MKRQLGIAFAVALATALALAGAATAPPPTSAQAVSEKSASAASVENGKELYDRYCAACHYPATTAKKIGPGLKAIYVRGKFEDGTPVNDQTMRRWIEKGGKNMPGFEKILKPQQLADLLAYLKTL
ncbi:MAG: cytochrome c [Acidobacteriia bacterium]|jgi:mono/diheme cytochrome c family protein|nr:cytochrome c [Terriglobia bacterium]